MLSRQVYKEIKIPEASLMVSNKLSKTTLFKYSPSREYTKIVEKYLGTTTTIGKIMAAMNEVSRVGFGLSYLALRTVYFPYVMATTCVSDFWKAAMLPTEQERHGTPSGIFWGVIVLAVLFTMLQMYWGTLVVRQLLKAMGIGSKTKKE